VVCHCLIVRLNRGIMNDLADGTDQVTLNGSSRCRESKSVPEFAPFIASHLEVIYSSLKSLPNVDFLRDIQHENPSDGGDNGTTDPLASLAAFREYMASPASSALQPVTQQDFSAPINDYFISSSHNTYLTGNQLYSDSDASAYTNVCIPLTFHIRSIHLNKLLLSWCLIRGVSMVTWITRIGWCLLVE
jgi:hypothetical protein